MPFNKDQMAIYVTERRRHYKEVLINNLGGGCNICGYNRHMDSLCLHHIDPKEKKFGLGKKMTSKSKKDIIEESRKCILLCTNCHGEVHAGFTEIPDTYHRLPENFEFPKLQMTEEIRQRIAALK